MNTRIAAAHIITSILQNSGSLSTLVPFYTKKVSESDRALMQQLSYGTLRYYPKLSCYLDFLLTKPFKDKDKDLEAVIVCAIYQLTETRIPSHAAVNEAVKACKIFKKSWATSLVNAVLRRFMRERAQIDEDLNGKVVFDTAHPEWLINHWKKAWPEHIRSIVASNNSQPPMTLRVNTNHYDQAEYIELLKQAGIGASITRISSDGVILEKPSEVTVLPGFLAGAISVQDEAAQLTPYLLNLMPNQRVLDACCAPGGKTCHILEFLKKKYKKSDGVVAVDISKKRLARVKENLERLHLKAKLINCDVLKVNKWWNEEPFDRILLDAPCSATGVIRRHPDVKILRKSTDIKKLAMLQLELIKAIWPTLKKNGILLYSTCSTLPQENDMVILSFLDVTPSATLEKIDLHAGLETSTGRQFLPKIGEHDGFFYARLRKL